MAAQEVTIARLGAWIARTLGATGSFGVELDTDGLGFQMPDAIANDPAVKAAGSALAEAGKVLTGGGEKLDAAILSGDSNQLSLAFAHLFEGLYQYVDAANAIVGGIKAKAASLPAPERNAVQAFAGLMPRRLMDFFVISMLEEQLPRLAFLLKLLGLVDRRVVEASGALNEPRYVRNELKLDRIKDLFKNPAVHFANVYGWGTGGFDPYDILRGVLAFYRPESSTLVGKVGADAFLRVGPFRWSRDSSVTPPGLMLDASTTFTKAFNERVEISPTWGMDFKTDLAIGGGIIFRLKPPFDLSAAPKAGTASGAVSFSVNRNAAARGMTIIGGNDLIHLAADNVGVGAGLTIGASTSGSVPIDPGVFGEFKQLSISLGSKDSDSFLASLLASADIKGTFDLGLGWKLKEGLVIKAAGGLEIAIPMHQSLGVAKFDTLHLILKVNPDASFSLETSASITGQVGPLTAVVERMGAIVKIAFSGGADKNLGPVDLALVFKPPNGVGLVVDVALLRGGGYLYFDYEKGEYAGALELTFSGFLALKAIGIISTRMPDGLPGFSLLIIITAEFGIPIQLGFGFTLIGVGGLLGLNRTMKLEELAEGVRTGAVESVMFPRDVVANAPRIISDLRRFFPPQRDTFLIGPMAKLGWGTPTLVSASLGIIIEVPPGNIAILGVLKCVLPDEDAALLVLQVKFIGALEVDKSRLWFFASLFGSRVLFITIGGEMGLLISWGDQPEFVLSVGGFHPKFNPPPMPFPTPDRVSLSILNESFARIWASGYFAVTSNTAQFGASVRLYFGLSAYAIDGEFGLDALFQFSPFHFTVSISASMGVKVFGAGVFSVRIRGDLEGTSPWHIAGEGSISVLFWDLDVPFSHTWGASADTVLPEIAALPILRAEFEKRENWLAFAPAGTRLSVSLRQVDATQELVLHPLGSLRISQRAVPLDLSIQRIGNQKVSDIDKAILKVTAPGLVQKAAVREPFATAQFQDMDAAAKLSAPGYEKQVAGADVSVSGTATRTTHAVKRVVLHELITIDNNYKEHLRPFYNVGVEWFNRLLSSNAIARSPLSKAAQAAKAPFVDQVKADGPGYVIADMSDNSAYGGTPTYASHAKAKDALAQINADRAKAGKYHVIPAAEAS
jgi:Family of unknown function (DUF6603)